MKLKKIKILGKYHHLITEREVELHRGEKENGSYAIFYYKKKHVHIIDLAEFNSGQWKKGGIK